MNYAPVTTWLHQKALKKSIPLSGTFELSPVCNFACRMCYVRKSAQEVAASPDPIVTYDEWIAIAKEAKDAGMLFLLLTGGEPLLWPRFWDLYDELYDMGLVLQVNTNGSLIDEKAIEHWQKRPPQRVNITLYGASDETYEALCGAKHVFARVRDNILALKNAGVLVKLNCSVTPQNAHNLKAICSFANENNFYLSAVSYMFPPVRRDPTMTGQNDRFTPKEAAWYHMQQYRYLAGEEKYTEYLKSLRSGTAEPLGLDESCVDPIDGKVRCRAGNTTFWLTWDGFMTPCGMVPEPKINVRSVGFINAWRKTVENTSAMRLSGLCAKCPEQNMCHSCLAMAVAETGRCDGVPTYLCKMVRGMKELATRELEGSNNF